MTHHPQSHPLARRVVTLPHTVTDPARGIVTAGAIYHLEDWWDRINGTGYSWHDTPGNPAVHQYAARIRHLPHIPRDDDVVYGHIGPLGHLVHHSELP